MKRSAIGLLLAVLLAGFPPATGREDGDSTPDSLRPLDVRLVVEETGGVDRPFEMVRSGVPLPFEAGLNDAGSLVLVTRDDRGEWKREVPLQARVTSRWDGPVEDAGLPARWVLLDFPASVPRHARSEYRLRTRDADAAPELPLVTDDGTAYRVDTGRLRFTVEKDRFGAFEGLEIRTGDAWHARAGGRRFEVRLIDAAGVEFLASRSGPREVVIEENGPLHAVILVRGGFESADGEPILDGWVGYSLRLHVTAGSSLVRAFFTLENSGLYGLEADWSARGNSPKWLHFDSLSIELDTGLSTDREVRLAGHSADVPVSTGKRFRLFQTHRVRARPSGRDDESRNFHYEATVGGRSVAAGTRSSGAMTVSAAEGEMSVGVRHFWQSYPKAISLGGSVLAVELWPEEGYWPNNADGKRSGAYQFEGGRFKTHEIAFDFAPGVESAPPALATRLASPLFARASDAWYAGSRAIDHLAPFAPPIGNPSAGAALNRMNQMQEAMVDVARAESQPLNATDDPQVPPISLTTQRESRGSAFKVNPYDLDLYGWFSFGDLPHALGWSSGHYDWPYGLLIQYLRHGGKREFLDVAEEMVRHRYDIDQYHGREQSHPNWFFFNGFQRSDRGWHGDYSRAGTYRSEHPPTPNNTWLAGLVLHHALTGDPRSLEAARENADACLAYYRLGIGITGKRILLTREHEIRAAALSVTNLIEFHRFTGESRYRLMAGNIIRNAILYSEEHHGSNGFAGLPDRRNLLTTILVLDALQKSHEVDGDPETLAVMLRILGRLKRIYLAESGYVELKRYMPLQLPAEWPPRSTGETEVAFGFMVCDAFAYAFLETGEPGYLEFARWLFHDSVVYFQAGSRQLVAPEFASAATYNPWRHVGYETRVNAWVLRGHQVYLFAEWLLAREGAPQFRFPNDGFRKAGPGRPESGRAAPPDIDPPLVSIGEVIAEDGVARIRLTTNEPTTVQVEYGTDPEKTDFTPRTHRADRLHEVRIAGLSRNRSYFFRLHVYDLAKNRTITEFRPLRTAADREPPRVTRVSSPDATTVLVDFSEAVDVKSAEDPESYAVGGRKVASATLDPTARRVRLTTSPLDPGSGHAVSVTGVLDLATPPNRVEGAGARVFYRDVTADDGEPGFQVLAGSWGETTTDPDSYGGTARYAIGDSGAARAEWRIDVPANGIWEVHAWWPEADPERNAAVAAHYRIQHADGVGSVRVNQRDRGGRWVLLAALPFRKGEPALIRLGTEGAGGTVFADAIRLVFLEP